MVAAAAEVVVVEVEEEGVVEEAVEEEVWRIERDGARERCRGWAHTTGGRMDINLQLWSGCAMSASECLPCITCMPGLCSRSK